ncbi:MAG: AEC family transporter [Firmicutes bacterium]|nr:AEC family transporter [Bacillota bacterium]
MIAVLLVRKIAQLFFILFLGWLVVRIGLIKAEDSKVLSKLALYLLVPFVILKSFQMELTPDIQKGMIFSFAMGILMHVMQIGFVTVGGKALRLDTVEQGSVAYSNTVNLIVPLVTSVLGPEWVIYSSAVASTQLMFLWSHGLGMFSGWKNMNVKKMFLNPNMISIAVGLVLLVTGIRLPAMFNEVAGDMGSMLGPFAMLVVGMLLAETDLREMLKKKRLYLVLFLRMIFCPAVFMIVLKMTQVESWMTDGHKLALTIFLAAASPAATTITQFAQLYDHDAKYAGAINIVSTLSCIVTMPAFVYIYEML